MYNQFIINLCKLNGFMFLVVQDRRVFFNYTCRRTEHVLLVHDVTMYKVLRRFLTQ